MVLNPDNNNETMRNGENILQQLDSMSADEIYEYACTYGSTHEAADISLLAELFVIAAGKGSEKAAWSAGRCYETGQGVAKDLSKAIEYYEQSYAAGYGQAAGSLGNLYFLGNGVEKDLEKAFALYLEGASKGSMQACCNAGMCLFYGYGTAVNENEGIRFLTHAAENGFETATQLLNEIYGKDV